MILRRRSLRLFEADERTRQHQRDAVSGDPEARARWKADLRRTGKQKQANALDTVDTAHSLAKEAKEAHLEFLRHHRAIVEHRGGGRQLWMANRRKYETHQTAKTEARARRDQALLRLQRAARRAGKKPMGHYLTKTGFDNPMDHVHLLAVAHGGEAHNGPHKRHDTSDDTDKLFSTRFGESGVRDKRAGGMTKVADLSPRGSGYIKSVHKQFTDSVKHHWGDSLGEGMKIDYPSTGSIYHVFDPRKQKSKS